MVKAVYNDITKTVESYLDQYQDLKKAIRKAQERKSTATSQERYEFWLEVENKLKEQLPKKSKIVRPWKNKGENK